MNKIRESTSTKDDITWDTKSCLLLPNIDIKIFYLDPEM